MIAKFDSLHRFEVPALTLCNPDSLSQETAGGSVLSNCIGRLNDVTPPTLTLNFNALSELSFTFTKANSGLHARDAQTETIYAAIQPRRFVYAENFGYFLITSVQEQYAGGLWQKQVTAQSCEKELCYRYLPNSFKEGTQTLRDVLQSLESTLSPWTVNHIDDTLEELSRTFESVEDKSLYDFLLQDLQEAFACVCEFDYRLRQIDIYDMETYAQTHTTDIHLTRANVVNELSIEESSEALYTVLDVEGCDGLSIQWANPLGTGKIYRFDTYLPWMSPALRQALTVWQNRLTESEAIYLENQKEILPQKEALSRLQQELAWRNQRKETFQTCLDRLSEESPLSDYEVYQMNQQANETLITSELLSEGQATIQTKLTEEEKAIAALKNSIEALQDKMHDTQKALDEIHQQLNFAVATRENDERLFSDELLRELSCYLFEGRYVDEYIASENTETLLCQSKLLLKRGKRELQKLSTPSRRFDIGTENFVFVEYFQPFTEQLESGCVVHVETEDGVMEPVHLTAFTINYDSHTLDMTFGSKYDKYDIRSLFDDVFGDIRKSASSIRQIRKQAAVG